MERREWRIAREPASGETGEENRIWFLARLHCTVPSEWSPVWDPVRDLSDAMIEGEARKLRESWGRPHQCVLTARDREERVIGFHWATCTPLEQRIPGMPWYRAMIHSLWVHPQWRRRGIARALKAAGEDWARMVGCGLLETQVHATNPRMRALNEALGYETVRWVMQKRLD